MQTEPRAAGDAVGLVTPVVLPNRVAEQSPDHFGAKFLAQQIEDSEDELIAGTEEGVRQQQQQQQQEQQG